MVILAAIGDSLEDLEFLVLILMGLGGSLASWLKKRRQREREREVASTARAAAEIPVEDSEEAGLPPFLEEKGTAEGGFVLRPAPAPPPPPVPLRQPIAPAQLRPAWAGPVSPPTGADPVLGELENHDSGFGDLSEGEFGTTLRVTEVAEPGQGGDLGTRLELPDGAESWRRAVVLAEILGRPRGLDGATGMAFEAGASWPGR